MWKYPVLIKFTGYRSATWLKLNFFTGIFQRFWPYNLCVKSVQIRSFLWSVFSRIRTEYGYLLRKFPYSVRMRENTDQKKLRICALFTQLISLRLCSTAILKNTYFCRIPTSMAASIHSWNSNDQYIHFSPIETFPCKC